jgi:pro-kumamolisin-like protein
LKRLALAVALGLVCAWAAAPAVAAKSPRITFYFGLKRPEAAARAAFFAVQAPSSPTYRRFLIAGEAAGRYGASAKTVRAVRRAGLRHGLRVRVDPSRVFARVEGTVARLQRVFHAPIRRQYNNETLSWAFYVGARHRLRLPRDMRPWVREVVPSFSRSQKSEREAHATAAGPKSGPHEEPPAGAPKNAGTWAGGCEQARKTGGYSYAQVRHAYGLDSVGSGGSAAIVNVGEGLTGGDLAANASCFGYPAAKVRTLLADGQARPFPRDTFEPQEDLALLRGMAPGLTSLTFAQTWLAPELWFLAPVEVLDAPRLPDVISISYGECERSVRGARAGASQRAGADLMDAVLARLGLAGVASFAAAGDFGSTCNGQPFPGVAWPASSPFLTAVGGTRLALNAANERSEEVVWNDTRWTPAEAGGGAGGGGFSAVSKRPPFQVQAPFDPTIPATTRRAVPDVSAHASIFPGWPVVLAGHWELDGGTSTAAPLLAGAFATLSARQRALGQPPLGPFNGLLYQLQETNSSALYDITAGDNSYDPKVPGYSATPGYDLASGLGVPNFTVVAGATPPPAP